MRRGRVRILKEFVRLSLANDFLGQSKGWQLSHTVMTSDNCSFNIAVKPIRQKKIIKEAKHSFLISAGVWAQVPRRQGRPSSSTANYYGNLGPLALRNRLTSKQPWKLVLFQ